MLQAIRAFALFVASKSCYRKRAIFIVALMVMVLPTAFGQASSKQAIHTQHAIINPTAREGFVTVAEGVRLFYRIAGQGRPVTVFLHGGPGMHIGNGWPDLEPLARGRAVLLYDQRGGGRSDLVTDPDRLTALAHVRDLEVIRQHFRIKRMTLIGYSWGAVLAALYAAEHPQQVERLLLLNPMPPARIPFDEQRTAKERELTSGAERSRMEELERTMFEAQDPRAVCSEIDRIYYKPYFFDPQKQSLMRTDNCSVSLTALRNRDRVSQAAMHSLGEWDFRPLLARLHMPALVVEGKESQVAVGGPEAWAQALPHSRLLLIEQAGHMPHVEQPGKFFPAVEKFLRGRWPERAKSLRPMPYKH